MCEDFSDFGQLALSAVATAERCRPAMAEIES
jgi:hypothetical protein